MRAKSFSEAVTYCFLLFFCSASYCFSQTTTDSGSLDNSASKPKVSPLKELGNDYHNSIKLLQNRFRIDHNVTEVTMVFFREYGSAPVVLVRPDGSKIFQSQVEGNDIFWYDAETYDMISIKNPVPGPWQAVGQIIEGSRVMVLSDVVLHADPLPPIIFSGEILKQTAYLTNGDKPIDYSEFRDVVSLSIELLSTNNPNYDNFGANNEVIATFEDNGRGMDERPMDGIFTGQFNLSVPAGEWKPVFRVVTPMFTREQVDDFIRLYPNPINISVELDGGGDGYHKLLIDANRDLVDINSLLIDGKVRFPNGDIQNFSLTDLSDKAREYLIIDYEYGIFRVKLTAYGKTVNGRDFILDVPEYSFLAAEPESEQEPSSDSSVADTESGTSITEPEVDSSETQPSIVDKPSAPQSNRNKDDSEGLLSLVLIINGAILGLGLIIIGIIWFIKRPRKSVQANDQNDERNESSTKESFISVVIAKVLNLLPLKKKHQSKSEAVDE